MTGGRRVKVKGRETNQNEVVPASNFSFSSNSHLSQKTCHLSRVRQPDGTDRENIAAYILQETKVSKEPKLVAVLELEE